jgi:hypothetical protein
MVLALRFSSYIWRGHFTEIFPIAKAAVEFRILLRPPRLIIFENPTFWGLGPEFFLEVEHHFVIHLFSLFVTVKEVAIFYDSNFYPCPFRKCL